MATATALPAREVSPTTRGEVAEAVRAAYEASRAIYPRGGGTALNYGGEPSRDGVQLDLASLNRIVDYTPRDMTIVVEAGVRMADLAETLAAEGQHLPIDVPRAGEATIGGVLATNWNGPRRYGHGTIRDYVIGIHAVDGRGVAFQGGGRVVKNVAGYDFCKLLTGSLGTLGVITQLALKVKPRPAESGTVVAEYGDRATADAALGRLVELSAPPVAIDLLVGTGWRSVLPQSHGQSTTADLRIVIVVRLEGTRSEVDWLSAEATKELRSAGGENVRRLEAVEADVLWARQVEFCDRGLGGSQDVSPLVVKVAVPPSAVMAMIEQVQVFDRDCTIQAHAGNGIVYARFSRFQQADVTRVLIGKLRPAAVRLGGSLVIVSTTLDGLTPHVVWGGRTDATVLLERVKQKFDPRNILNPGRFVYY